jgi:hypothetical protein
MKLLGTISVGFDVTDQRKQAALQWLQDQSEINGDNLNSVRRGPADISGLKWENI